MAEATTGGSERRELGQNDRRILGYVVQCDGAHATLAAIADTSSTETSGIWTVGRLISINLGGTRTVGLVYSIDKHTREWTADHANAIQVSVELVGEVRDREGMAPIFDRGITQYPHIGAVAHRIRARDLAAVYDLGGRQAIRVGSLAQDSSIEANIAIEECLSRHFAVVGTTGVGKSTAVSLIVRRAAEAKPDLRVLMLDPHNEYGGVFGDSAISIDATTLDLPFWLFKLDEFVEVLFRGRESVPEEIDILRDLMPIAKQIYRSGSAPGLRRGTEGITADTPVPYRIVDLIRLIDDRMGLLDSKHDRPTYRSLRVRIEAALTDPRYRFMFGQRVVEDTIEETIGKLFRIPDEGHRITCFEMAGLPSEIVNAVCSVLARLSFDVCLHSAGKYRILVMCEEAHRYLPSDSRLGFAPTRQSLSRIAKEGRKYGCNLGVITQRPGELDPTILSQCSTVFAMRLANEQDQAIIRSAIADSSASSLAFLSSMGQREAIVFGEGVATTMRMKFETIPRALIPGIKEGADEVIDRTLSLSTIVERMRNLAAIDQFEQAMREVPPPAPSEQPTLRRKLVLSEEDPNYGYGLKSSTFGSKI